MGKIYAMKASKMENNGATLRKLFNILSNQYEVLECFPGTSSLQNVTAIIKVPKGPKIGIETQGSTHSRLGESLIKFKNKGCDIIFCTCLTSGKTVKTVKSMEPEYEVIFTEGNSADALWRMAKV
ncbi:hypothetical protein [Treponema sp.]|uniref:hypothetical protein n=1 Tax=Treponema sp. TaxID=166 RepID=UPI0025E31627|nr:hypothetical protein [Treponema sp.]MBR4323848.1 hypothetical protein [Treponema sp.]